jgi:hypothetical protein
MENLLVCNRLKWANDKGNKNVYCLIWKNLLSFIVSFKIILLYRVYRNNVHPIKFKLVAL